MIARPERIRPHSLHVSSFFKLLVVSKEHRKSHAPPFSSKSLVLHTAAFRAISSCIERDPWTKPLTPVSPQGACGWGPTLALIGHAKCVLCCEASFVVCRLLFVVVCRLMFFAP